MTQPYGDQETTEYGGVLKMYNIEQLQQMVQTVVDNYYGLDNSNMLEYIL